MSRRKKKPKRYAKRDYEQVKPARIKSVMRGKPGIVELQPKDMDSVLNHMFGMK